MVITLKCNLLIKKYIKNLFSDSEYIFVDGYFPLPLSVSVSCRKCRIRWAVFLVNTVFQTN
jgi:hypothetical protein